MIQNIKEKLIVGFTPGKAIILVVCITLFIGTLVFIGLNLKTMKENEAAETSKQTSKIEHTINEVF